VIVDVLPLPPPPEALAGSFDGLVGELSVGARLLPPEVSAGEAATLEVTLAGRGNLESLTAPPLPAIPGVEVLPAHEEGGNRVVGRLVEAERVWRFPLLPERAGQWELPPISITYFDPERGEYRTTSSQAMTLAVRPAVADPDGRGERHPIRNAALPAGTGAAPLGKARPLALRPAVAAGAALGLAGRGRGEAAARAPERSLCHRFDQRLIAAAGEERPRQAAREIEAAWRELLAAALAVPAELPPTAWVAELPAAARGDGRAEELARVVDDLHYLRFAPQLSAVGELTGELVERSRRLARRLAACGARPAAVGPPRPASVVRHA
jgi:hypothetical protein